MKKQNAVNKKGFTLMELLMVVVIIGILSAVAVPMYKKAVEKSKVSDALTTMQAVAKSEHNWYLINNRYTDDFSDLDIDFTDKDGIKAEGESFESNNYLFGLGETFIEAYRKNGEYTLYKLYDNQNIFCSPMDHYICEQYNNINKNLCQNTLEALWHNSSSSCYRSEKERCLKEYGTDAWQDGNFCGYTNQSGKTIIVGEGQTCSTSNGTCQHITVEAGGTCKLASNTPYGCYGGNFKPGSKCISNSSTLSCTGSTFDNAVALCTYTWNSYCGSASTFKNGAICVGYGGNDCVASSFINGSICYANHKNSCGMLNGTDTSYKTTYDATSCCCGTYCPDYAPKCADIGKTCDPQYMS